MAEHATSTPVPAAHRAGFPLHIIEIDDRRRLEAAVDRLGAYHDRYARHARRAEAAMDRIERLRQSAIGALDVIDGDADLEPAGDDEPSLSAAVPAMSWEGSQDAWLQGPDDDREYECEDEGAQCEDEGHDSDRELDNDHG